MVMVRVRSRSICRFRYCAEGGEIVMDLGNSGEDCRRVDRRMFGVEFTSGVFLAVVDPLGSLTGAEGARSRGVGEAGRGAISSI